MNAKKSCKNLMSKRFIIHTVLIVWVVFSLGYIAVDQYNDFKLGVLNNAYMSGRTESVNELISLIKNESCEPINVSNGSEGVRVIDIQCLQAASDLPAQAGQAAQVSE